jgi:hypothetical protein
LSSIAVPRTSAAFSSTALVSLDTPRAIALARDNGILNKLSAVRFKYVGLVQTDVVAAPVAARLHLPIGQVRGRLSATASPADLLLRVSCRASGADQARRCTDALAGVLVDYIRAEQSSNGIPPILQMIATPVEPAGTGTELASHRRRAVAVSLLIGVLAAGAVLVVAARGRRRVNDRP